MLTFGQATTTRPATRPDDLAAIPQWWYACLYTGGSDAADDVVAGILPPLLAEARTLGAGRWFFIRYFDEAGPHIRLRVFGPGRSLDRLVRSTEELSAHLELIATKPRPTAHQLVPGGPDFGPEAKQIGVRPGVYEPEVEKYGGLEGVELAEQMFEFSSELALWGVSEHVKGGGRDALAALLLADSVGALSHGRRAAEWPQRSDVGWLRYWKLHLGWWAGDASEGGFAQRLELHADGHLPATLERMRRTAADPGVEAWRRRWFRAMDDYLAAAGAAGGDRSPQHLTFHQNHMLMNRLGYLPREEALLGLYARDWIARSGDQQLAPHPSTPHATTPHATTPHASNPALTNPALTNPALTNGESS